jgi:hypothetical protein
VSQVESRRKSGGGVVEEARQGETSHGSGGNRMYSGFFVLFVGFHAECRVFQ